MIYAYQFCANAIETTSLLISAIKDTQNKGDGTAQISTSFKMLISESPGLFVNPKDVCELNEENVRSV